MLTHNGQDNRRWMGRIVVDDLFGRVELRGRGQRLAAARVADESRVSAAGDLHPEAMPAPEAVCRWPQVKANPTATIWLSRRATRDETQKSIADIDRLAGWVNIAQAGKEIGVLKTGSDVEFSLDRPDNLYLPILATHVIRSLFRPTLA